MKRQILAVLLLLATTSAAHAWDSDEGWDAVRKAPIPGGLTLFNFLQANVKSTHTALTEDAIREASKIYPDLNQALIRKALTDGANAEMHELPNTTDKKETGALRPYYQQLNLEYGLDLEAKRKAHLGTNEGSNDMEGWWRDAQAAYRAGNRKQAYFIVGMMLHMVEDMGVPAHGHKVYHQGTPTEFDAVEAFAVFVPNDMGPYIRITPGLRDATINRTDPGFADPVRYYDFGGDWSRADSPGYVNRLTSFNTLCPTPLQKVQFIIDRRARTEKTAEWMLKSAQHVLSTLPSSPSVHPGEWPGLPFSSIDAAVLWPNGKVYIFKGTQYVRYDLLTHKVDAGYPLSIHGHWPGVPFTTFDAVAVWPNGKAYIFSGNQYVRYDIAADRADPGFPLSIQGHWPGLPFSRVDAVAVWPNGKAYFFSGIHYARYDIKADRTDPGGTLMIVGHWPGLAFASIDDVIVLPTGKAHFFRGNQYVSYDVLKDRADPGYPLFIGSN